MRANQSIFFVEVTDMYDGEANYSWVHRFKVHASSHRGAIRKVQNEMNLGSVRSLGTFGDSTYYKVVNAAICAFVDGYEDQAEHYSNVKSI